MLAFPFFVQWLYYSGVAAFNPYLAMYFKGIGLSGEAIGLLTGLGPLVSMLGAPILTGLADTRHRHRLVITAAIIGSTLFVCLIPTSNEIGILLAIIFLQAFLNSPIIGLADTATLSMLGGKTHLYGRVRLGGTIGFALASIPAAAIVSKFGLGSIFWMFPVAMLLCLGAAQGLSFTHVERGSSFFSGLGEILSSKRWLIFLGLVLVAGTGMSVINTYFVVYMDEAGVPRSIMGLAIAIATVMEIPVLLFSNRFMKYFKTRTLLIIGISVIGVRLLLYVAFPHTVSIFLIQLLHGFTFVVVWLAGVRYANENAPTGLMATAQGIFGGVMMNLGSALGNFVGGWLMQQVGTTLMYGIFGIGVLAGLAILLLVEKGSSQKLEGVSVE